MIKSWLSKRVLVFILVWTLDWCWAGILILIFYLGTSKYGFSKKCDLDTSKYRFFYKYEFGKDIWILRISRLAKAIEGLQNYQLE